MSNELKKCSALKDANVSYAASTAVNAAALGAQNVNSAMSKIDALRQQLADVSNERDGLRVALGGMLFAFDDGVGTVWSAPILDHARTLCPAMDFDTVKKLQS
ncbi:hypothetical protein [Pseudomonas viridiflava]|uniref:hypothetical protein n=1 Tax=Pseudomonas viridiflava TaxID=33069 RepID=UPI001C31A5BB|nr:hypothetical protein [Pseudomonas viridiflava]QXG49176.1 hypothetical protein KTT57_09215 [Pseudomonas viridiflava]